MSVIDCKYCGEMVAGNAVRCPSCGGAWPAGQDVKAAKIILPIAGIIFVVAVVLMLLLKASM